VGFGIDRRARSRKGKGLFRRGPDPKQVGERLGWLLLRMDRRAKVRTGTKDDRFVAEVRYHDAAPLAKLVVGPDAELTVRADTSVLGPGYHADILARLAPILDELEYAWTETEGDPIAGTQAWLAETLRGEGTIRIGVPDHRAFLCDAPILTMLGPRDEAWRAAVLADPEHGRDAFPWWQAGKGRAALANALVAMWLEVPWREPIDSDERDVMKQIDADLTAAHEADPALELPYAEWHELLRYLDMGPTRENAIAKLANGRTPVIGYRRYAIDVALSGGWSLHVPGSFVGSWDEDHTRYWSTDGDRSLEFTSLTADGEDDSARLLAVAPPVHPVVEERSEGTCRARVEIHEESGVKVVIGLVADAPHVAILTCKDAIGDAAWALDAWRSLRRS
jgi:hypothetical protein